MKIAIDGPAGSGKSTVAKLIAQQLGFHYLDTGAMYRAVAQRALATGIAVDDAEGLEAIAVNDPIRFAPPLEEGGAERVFIADTEVTKEIRTPEVDKAVSPVSACPEVRRALVQQQRDIAADEDIVMEGRDIGTNVFPDAEVKVFLSATPEERARRRFLQNQERGVQASYEDILADIKRRDEADSSRETDPLKPADDAFILDTTDLTIEQVVECIEGLVRKAR